MVKFRSLGGRIVIVRLVIWFLFYCFCKEAICLVAEKVREKEKFLFDYAGTTLSFVA